MDEERNTISISLKVTPAQYAEIKAHADQRGIKITELFRDALAMYTGIDLPAHKAGNPQPQAGVPKKKKTGG